MKYLGRYIARLLGKSLTLAFNALPLCVRDLAVSWHKNLDTIVTVEGEVIEGLVDFDGDDDIIEIPRLPLTGVQTISFKLGVDSTEISGNRYIIYEDGNTSRLLVILDSTTQILRIYTTAQSLIYSYASLPDFDGSVKEWVINKNGETITSLYIDGVLYTNTSTTGTGTGSVTTTQIMGRIGAGTIKGVFYDLNWNGTNVYTGYPNGNLDSAWVDTVGSSNGVVLGSPTTTSIDTTVSYVKDSIGTRTDTVYYGQYLDAGIDVLDFDGVDDYVSFSSVPDVTGSKILSFTLRISAFPGDTSPKTICYFDDDSPNDKIWVYLEGVYLKVQVRDNVTGALMADLTGLLDSNLNVVITKTTGNVSSILINNQDLTLPLTGGALFGATGAFIGSSVAADFLENALIWDFLITGISAWKGYPAGNTDAAWVDTIGSNNGTVNGSPTTTSISSVINFYRTSGTFDYTDPSDGSLVEAVSIPGTGLYTIPANGICEIGVTPKTGHKKGLLDFDGTDDFIRLSADPDITGTKTISFYMYLERSDFSTYTYILNFGNTSDKLSVFFNNDICYTSASLNSSKTKNFDISSYVGSEVFFEVDKINDGVEGAIVDIRIGGVSQTLNSGGPYTVAGNSEIGANGNGAGSSMASDMLIYDITVANTGGVDINNFPGHPDGNLDSAWDDTIGAITATVFGNPSVTENTYEYTSFYLTCETAGTVLHDTMDNSIHISVDSPSWSESLYGSDWLNQNGFSTKIDSDSEGYDWTTNVDSTPIALDDDTLIPFKKNDSVASSTLEAGLETIL